MSGPAKKKKKGGGGPLNVFVKWLCNLVVIEGAAQYMQYKRFQHLQKHLERPENKVLLPSCTDIHILSLKQKNKKNIVILH